MTFLKRRSDKCKKYDEKGEASKSEYSKKTIVFNLLPKFQQQKLKKQALLMMQLVTKSKL